MAIFDMDGLATPADLPGRLKQLHEDGVHASCGRGEHPESGSRPTGSPPVTISQSSTVTVPGGAPHLRKRQRHGRRVTGPHWLVAAALPAQCSAARPRGRHVCQTVVDSADPAWRTPSKFVGPACGADAVRLPTVRCGWTFPPDGTQWRRVVPLPAPVEIVEQDVSAELLVILTAVPAVMTGFAIPQQRPIHATARAAMEAHAFADGSMGPKVRATPEFASATGRRTAIGSLQGALAVIDGDAGTQGHA